MAREYNVNDINVKKRLEKSKVFKKYLDFFLSNTCKIRVNNDDFLTSDQFTILTKKRVLPRRIYLFGKKTESNKENNIYLNYWMDIFLKTIENGYLTKFEFKKSKLENELTIGVPLKFRQSAFNYSNWNRENIVSFLSCLFNTEIELVEYEQQDLMDNFLVA